MQDNFILANTAIKSRLFLGTGKFSSNELMKQTIEESSCDLVTVALKRASLTGDKDKFANILEFLDSSKNLIVPNTSGATNAKEAVRMARLARQVGLPSWIKVEIHPEANYLLPDPIETFIACEELVKDGFTVLPYINADPALSLRLQEIGVAAVMPLGSCIGSGKGLETLSQIKIIIEQASVPVIVDAGIGVPSDASKAMEIGADAVLINTAVAVAKNPPLVAKAFDMAIKAGRIAYLQNLCSSNSCGNFKASATSPLTGFLNE